MGYSVNLVPSGLEDIVGVASADAFRLGRLLTAVLFLVFARRIPKIQQILVSMAAVLMSVASATLIIAFHQSLMDSTMLALGAVFVAIASYSFLVWVFYRHFAKHFPTNWSIWCICASLVLEVLLSAIVSMLVPSEVQMLLVVVTPILVTALYYIACALDRPYTEPRLTQRISAGFEKYALLAQVVLITVALVFIQALSASGTWGETRGATIGMEPLSWPLLLLIAAVIVALTLLVFILPRRLSLSLRCIIGFTATLAGLQILALANDLTAPLSVQALTVGIEQFSHLVRWMMIIECVRLISISSYRVAGVAHAASALAALLWMHVLEPLAITSSIFVMILVYLLLLAVVFIFIWGYTHRQLTPWLDTDTAQAAATQAALSGFAQRFDLSAREREILALLLQGQKRVQIEQTTGLSEGTVKTHISNIYRKLDVHSKHEMHQLYLACSEKEL
ncbi:MAG: helix-turn-helix transcriptional regulator [Coriobacteriales bacterium]|nr:helix-turn-helix transcriptional regulator [Coriobacteriales bacterium]